MSRELLLMKCSIWITRVKATEVNGCKIQYLTAIYILPATKYEFPSNLWKPIHHLTFFKEIALSQMLSDPGHHVTNGNVSHSKTMVILK